ncbi:glycosyltransferase [Actinomadura rugatobispora]|uniref:Glycosyltransferase n=1 Tax=Actinomadura rugatobispora TaxID=1994 RepID=A0ABW1AJ86_9ACTN|nr:glycosyltransferase [Actinomadura rugatobispora]
MTRVLHVITGLEHGGAERQLALLLDHLPKDRVECEVAVLTHAGALGAGIRAGGVPVHEIGMRSNRDAAALPRLVRLIRKGRYDVVHTHLYRACVYGRVAAWLARTPRIVATEHSLGDGHIEGRRTTPGVRALYRASERLGHATVAVSPSVTRRLLDWGVRPARLVTITNAIDAGAFAFSAERRAAVRGALGIGPEEFVVGSTGRLVPSKSLDLLVRAFAGTGRTARPGSGDGRLLIVGSGPARPELEELAENLGVAGRTHFTGGTADVPGMLAAMDAYAAPSAHETFGLGVLEALAAGLPVLYRTCPAIDDLPSLMAPRVQRLPSWVAAWSAALDALPRTEAPTPARAAPPPLVGHYAVEARIAQLVDLYHEGPAAVRPVGGSALVAT